MKSIHGAIYELNEKIADQEFLIKHYRDTRNLYQDKLTQGTDDAELKITWRFNLNKACYNITLATKELEALKEKLRLVTDISSGLIELN